MPAGLHPSHPGYVAAMRMSAMASQVKVIQHRSGPRKKHPSQVQKTAAVTTSGGEEAEPDGMTNANNKSESVESNVAAGAQEEKQLGCSNNNKSSHIVCNSKAMEQHLSEGGDSCTESPPATIKTSAIIQEKQIFDESTVASVARWVSQLDRVVAAGRAADPIFASLYNSCLSQVQRQAHCMATVAQWEEHRLEDGEDLLEITSEGWICNMCPNHFSKQKRPGRIYTHLLSDKHMNEVKTRAALRGVQNVASAAAAHAQLQMVPQMIRQGTCIAAAQASLSFTVGSLMLEGLKVPHYVTYVLFFIVTLSLTPYTFYPSNFVLKLHRKPFLPCSMARLCTTTSFIEQGKLALKILPMLLSARTSVSDPSRRMATVRLCHCPCIRHRFQETSTQQEI